MRVRFLRHHKVICYHNFKIMNHMSICKYLSYMFICILYTHHVLNILQTLDLHISNLIQ